MEFFVILLFLAIGFSAAILGALIGVGGGFMMVPIFVFMGITKNYAVALSLFVIIFTAVSATIQYVRKRTINYRLGLIYVPFTIVGALFGAYLLTLISNLIFKIVFSGLVVYAVIRLLFIKREEDPPQLPQVKQRRSYYWVILWGFLSGFTANFLGIGGGIISVPIFTLFFLESMHVATSTSLFVMIFTASFSSLQNYITGRFNFQYIDMPLVYLGLIIALGAVIGAQIGSLIQTRLKGRNLQILFGVFMMSIALPLLWLGH